MEKTNEVKVEKTVGEGVGFERIRQIGRASCRERV